MDRDRKAELLRQRRRLIRTLQETGMTDEEIERELGVSLKEIDEESKSLNPYFAAEASQETEVVDAEVVSVEAAVGDKDGVAQSMSRAKAVGVALVPLHAQAPRSDGNGSEPTEPIKWSEEWWETIAPGTDYRRCRGHSTRTGSRCKQVAMNGTTVCKNHGGLAPQVQRAAKVRLDMAADRMAANLLGLAEYAGNDGIKLGATNSALDRSGIIRPTQVEVGPIERKPYEDIFDAIGGGSRDQSRARRSTESGSLSSPPAPASGDDDIYDEQGRMPAGEPYTWDDGLSGSHTGAFDRPVHDPGGPAFDGDVNAEAALRAARRANARAGKPQLAIESPHKRYRRQ